MSETPATPTITIDGKAYELSNLSDAAKSHISSVRLVDQKIAEAQQTIAVLQTARNAYMSALQQALPEAA